jgi:quinol monooxygenase YgiN
MVTVEYRVSAANRTEFLAGLAAVGHERRRDGAYDWDVFQDTAHPERFVEIFFVDSWLEHLRQHQRVTKADALVQARLQQLAHGEPQITHYLAARRRPP